MTSNFLQFNPNLTNALNDSDYLANTQRTGGIVDGVAQTALFNKAFSQMATMAAAVAEALSDLGYTISDSNYSGIVDALADSFIPDQSGSSGKVLGTNGTVASWVNAGKILQVVQTSKTDTFSSSSTSLTDITGLSVSITPKANTSKVLILAAINGAVNNTSYGIDYALLRGSTAISVGASPGSRLAISAAGLRYPDSAAQIPQTAMIAFLDEPATTSSTTYKIQGRTAISATWYVNRSETDTNSSSFSRYASNIIALEVGA